MAFTAWFWLTTLTAAGQAPAPAVGTCLGGTCEVGVQVTSRDQAESRPARGFARGAAWMGLFAGVLSVAGSVGIAVVDHPESERITRGVWLGHLTLAVPVVAIGSLTSRKRARVQGLKGMRTLGWTAYTGVLGNGALQWYLVLTDSQPRPGVTIGLGAAALLAFLPHAFDAYVAGRASRLKGLASLRPTANGFAVHF